MQICLANLCFLFTFASRKVTKASYYFTQASTHRAIPAERVAELARHHQLNGNTYPTVAQAFQAAVAEAQPDDFIFVGGSSYVVADLLSDIDF